MKFTKMHGIGNDYIYVNCLEWMPEEPAKLAVRLSDRHFGVGSDGLILICPSEIADFKMVMYNADGSRAQMCGNGIRCVGKYVYDRGLTQKDAITVETDAGIKELVLNINEGRVASVTVDMGKPELSPKSLPALFEGDQIVDYPLENTPYRITCVSMGNPHAVIFTDDIDGLDLPLVGPSIENHPAFPQRVNTEFVEALDEKTLKMRVWERGSGETLACGTGACASLVAAVLNGKSGGDATVRLRGGDLEIRWDRDSGHVLMTGPAAIVFDGEISQM